MKAIFEWLETNVGMSEATFWDIVASIVTIAILVALRFAVLRIVGAREKDLQRLYRWRRGATYVAIGLGVLMVGRIWLESVQTLTTILGFASAGLAIALRDPIVNLVGWVFIMWRRPFELGDRIQIGTLIGDVVDQGIADFSVMEVGVWVEGEDYTGRVVRVPNGLLFTQTLHNHHAGWFRYVWNEVEVVITFESNWDAAKHILEDIVTRHGAALSREVDEEIRTGARNYLFMRETNLKPMVFVRVAPERGIVMTLRFLCDPRRKRGTAMAVWSDVLEQFSSREDIDFAYPTQRFFSNPIEGKHGAKVYMPGVPFSPAGPVTPMTPSPPAAPSTPPGERTATAATPAAPRPVTPPAAATTTTRPTGP
jgi:small-conductance mechanosensitive channel